MRKRFSGVWTVTIVLLFLFFFFTQASPVRSFVVGAINPAAGWIHSLANSWTARAAQKESLSDANLEIQRLREMAAKLLIDQSQFETLTEENASMKSLLNFTSRTKLNPVVAEAVAYDPSTTRKLMIVDKGTADGVQRGSAVVSPDGMLVGVIERSDPNASVVRLLRDPQTKIAASIVKLGDSSGIITPIEGGALSLRYLSENLQIDPGSAVTTSSLNSTIPANIPIGVVNSTAKESDSPFQRAILETFVQPEDLRYVAIIPVAKAL